MKKKQPLFIFNTGGILFGVKTKKSTKKDMGYLGLANPFKFSPFEALGLRKRPKGSYKMTNLFTGK